MTLPASARGRTIVVLIAIVLVSALSAGCTVRQHLLLEADGSGEASVSVELHPVMIAYMNDLMVAMTGVEGEYPVFDLEQLTASFAEREGVALVGISQSSRGSLSLALEYDDINAVFEEEGGSDVVRLERDGSARELTVRLDREAVHRFLEFAPEESTAMARYLFPPADGSVSREEYRDEMAWALEEYEDRETVERVLDQSEIEVRVTPVGRIVSQQGGRIEDGAMVFSVPILELLTLADERTYSLVFEP